MAVLGPFDALNNPQGAHTATEIMQLVITYGDLWVMTDGMSKWERATEVADLVASARMSADIPSFEDGIDLLAYVSLVYYGAQLVLISDAAS